MQNILDKVITLSVEYGPKFILAVLVLIIGFWIIKKVTKLFGKLMKSKSVDVSLQSFLQSLIGVILKVLLLISVFQMIGVETTSFVALIGAAGLAVGMALQGSLSNFAGGVLILLFKPYKVGDFIEAQGYAGEVKDIHIFTTKLKTPDLKIVIIPNSALSNGNIVNYSTSDTRRVDIAVGIDYNADIKKARTVILDQIEKHPLTDKTGGANAPLVAVSNLGDNSVNLTIRTFCKSEDYWKVYYELIENIKEALSEAQINIPFPQMDVHLKNA